MHEIPSELGIDIWQVVVDLLGLADVAVSFVRYPASTIDGEDGWEQQMTSNREAFPNHHPEDVISHGHFVFRQPVFFEKEPRELSWPAYYLPTFLAHEETLIAGTGRRVRNHEKMAELLREQFLRCRHVPTFGDGDPLPGFACCRRPLDCERTLR